MKLGLLLFGVLFLTGCQLDNTPDQKAKASTSVTTPQPQHNYVLYGNAQSGEFMVDSATGTVWQYEKLGAKDVAFVKLPVLDKTLQSSLDDDVNAFIKEQNGQGKKPAKASQ